MSAGSSAEARSAALKAAAQPSGRWGRFKAALGLAAAPSAEALAEADHFAAGAEGERRTAQLLLQLAPEGWYGLWDRHVPGSERANADHVLISPGGRLFLADAKLWSSKFRVRVVNGRLHHGTKDYGKAIDNARYESEQILRAVTQELAARRTPGPLAVVPLIVVHNAPVDDGGFILDGVEVLPANRALKTLRSLAGTPDPSRAAQVATAAERVLPRYVEREQR